MFPGEGLREAIKIPQLWCSMEEELSETWSLSGFPWESKEKMTAVWLLPGKVLGKLAGEFSLPSPGLDMPVFSLYILNVVMGQLVKCAGWIAGWLAGSRKWAETKPFVGYEVAKVARPRLLWCLQSKQLFQKMLATLHFLLGRCDSPVEYMWVPVGLWASPPITVAKEKP